MLKKLLFSFLFLFTVISYGQKLNIENYQFVIVADKFDFVKNVDQYQTSSLTKFLFKKKGFKVFLSNEKYPDELINNKCLALFVSVKNESSMFSIKNSIEVKDCFNTTVYSSKVGKSLHKEYKKGYHDAIRKAFNTMTDFVYNYNATLPKSKTEIKKQTEELEKSKPIQKDIITVIDKKESSNTINVSNLLTAKNTNRGYALFNTKDKLVFKLLKTELTDVFIIEGKNGIFYKKNNIWKADYYNKGLFISKDYRLKF